MTEQKKREKVIKGLEEVQHYIKVENLPAHTLKAKLVIDDAIALLKAQQPRLLTLDEIHDSMVVYLETGEKFIKIVDDDGVVLAIGGSERTGAKCFITVWDVCVAAKDDEYNIAWRAWSQRPTKEQMEGTPWN